MTHITKGANTPVPAAPLRVAVCRLNVPGAPAVDASALLLDAAGKVRGDADLVFYNQPAHPSGAVRHAGTGEGGGQFAEWLELDLPRVEPGVQRVLIAASCDGGVFGQVPGLYVQALTVEGAVVAQYAVTDATSETAFVLGEFYRRNGEWKFRAVGQGYASGLAGLATDFGIAVADDAGQPVPPTPHVPSTPTYATPVAPPASPVPSAPPVKTPDAPPSFGPDFPPYTQRGHGNGVVSVDVPLPPGPVVVEAWHQGDGYFGLHTLNRRNKDEDLLFNSTLRDFRGRVLVQPPKDRPLRLRAEADAEWTVLVQPLSVLRRLDTAPLSGYGPEVVAYAGPVADLDVDFAGDEDGGGYIGVWSLEADRLHDLDDRDLLVNDTDRLRQTVPIADGPLLLMLEADGPWQLTARPLHTAAHDSTTHTPGAAHVHGAPHAPGTLTGYGEKTITLDNPAPGRPALLEYRCREDYPGGLGHRVLLVDEYGDEEELLQGSRHGRHGRTLLFPRGEPRVRLRLTDVGEWSLRLLPVEEAPPLTGPAEGRGSTVFRYQGPPALLGLCRTAPGDTVVITRTVQADGRAKVSADTRRRRPVTGPLWVTPAGHCYVQVWTTEDTGWRIEPADPAGAPVLDRWPVEGQGYGVVRHTGPESEVMVQHDALGDLSLPVLWELDERLEPVRRISTASGLQRIPSGFLQIRTSGRWALEPRA